LLFELLFELACLNWRLLFELAWRGVVGGTRVCGCVWCVRRQTNTRPCVACCAQAETLQPSRTHLDGVVGHQLPQPLAVAGCGHQVAAGRLNGSEASNVGQCGGRDLRGRRGVCRFVCLELVHS
jgi:hypothetical protein